MLSSIFGQVDHAATSESSDPRKLEYWWQYLEHDNRARICKLSEQNFCGNNEILGLVQGLIEP